MAAKAETAAPSTVRGLPSRSIAAGPRGRYSFLDTRPDKPIREDDPEAAITAAKDGSMNLTLTLQF
jgi:hypothetical protein